MHLIESEQGKVNVSLILLYQRVLTKTAMMRCLHMRRRYIRPASIWSSMFVNSITCNMAGKNCMANEKITVTNLHPGEDLDPKPPVNLPNTMHNSSPYRFKELIIPHVREMDSILPIYDGKTRVPKAYVPPVHSFVIYSGIQDH